jgi:hypothetical protein
MAPPVQIDLIILVTFFPQTCSKQMNSAYLQSGYAGNNKTIQRIRSIMAPLKVRYCFKDWLAKKQPLSAVANSRLMRTS